MDRTAETVTAKPIVLTVGQAQSIVAEAWLRTHRHDLRGLGWTFAAGAGAFAGVVAAIASVGEGWWPGAGAVAALAWVTRAAWRRHKRNADVAARQSAYRRDLRRAAELLASSARAVAWLEGQTLIVRARGERISLRPWPDDPGLPPATTLER